MMGTALAHGALLALVFVAAQRAKPATNIVYEVNLVAAPLPNPAGAQRGAGGDAVRP